MSRDSETIDIMVWADSVEDYTLPPLTLSLPKSVAPSEIISDDGSASFIFDILDPTTLSYAFDWSCLEGLDDQLLYYPTISFADQCYHDAVDNAILVQRRFSQTKTTSAQRQSTTDSIMTPRASLRVNPYNSSYQGQSGHLHQQPVNWSDESDSDTDECKTFDEEVRWYSNGDISDIHPVLGDFAQVEPGSSVIFFDHTTPPPLSPKSPMRAGLMEEDRSFILFEPYPYSHGISMTPRPEESVGYFPVPHGATSNLTANRFAALVSKLPGRKPFRSQNQAATTAWA